MKRVNEKVFTIRKSVMAAAALAALSACGGGGSSGSAGTGGGNSVGSGNGAAAGTPGTPTSGGGSQQLSCVAYISTGFSGDLNAMYTDGWGGVPQGNLTECAVATGIGWQGFGGEGGGDGGGDGGGGGGGGGDGGAGGGAGEGKVLGGLMVVNRLSDGKVLGSALTDDKQGLVTIRPRAADGPVLLTLQGRAGARYYDESKKDYLPFEEGRVLHALIDRFDENVGVTAFSEAAYRYAINHFATDPAKVAAGQAPQLKTMENLRLTAEQVLAANNAIRDAINNALPKTYQLPSVKSLPTPVDASSPATTALLNRYGISAVVTGGLAIASGNYAFNPQRPALEITDELASDLTDGRINGFGLDGKRVNADPVAGSGPGQPHYDANQFPVFANVGANTQAKTISASQIFAAVRDPVSVGVAAGYQNPGIPIPHAVGCVYFVDNFLLTKDGTIDLQRRSRTSCSGVNDPITNVPPVKVAGFLGQTDPVLMAVSDGSSAFASTTSGELKVWGSGGCGVLGTGQDTLNLLEPATVPGVHGITSVALSYFTTVARDKTGHVFSWGSDEHGALGLGAGAKPDKCALRSSSASYVPRQIAGLDNIVSVAGDNSTFYAIRSDGKLFGWGNNGGGLLWPRAIDANGTLTGPDSAAPIEIPDIDKVQSVVVSGARVVVLRSDGTVWQWGNLGNQAEQPIEKPTAMAGFPGPVRELVADPAVALLADGRVVSWDRSITVIAGLPRIRHLVPSRTLESGNTVLALSADDERVFQIRFAGQVEVSDVTADFR